MNFDCYLTARLAMVKRSKSLSKFTIAVENGVVIVEVPSCYTFRARSCDSLLSFIMDLYRLSYLRNDRISYSVYFKSISSKVPMEVMSNRSEKSYL